ncbi:4Fe-4S ferredoxin, iron-sulfur binding domain protein [Desulforamulus reducens MI-1]|uniref:4Fe-4S ferredoxin, iron-sulfur binding domain protein n=2 Tax=Desulforamulus TaxID=2916693 RepID=A4J0W2_DESRM|nr:4Fe-4S ferredoxin, iron-sulfur binding domain protein [Desulforamulus reducens MI-1]
MTYVAWAHQFFGGGPNGRPPIDAFCPFGGLESLYGFIAYGEFIKRTNLSNVILLVGTILTAIVVGRAFCGWICPLGTLQEWLNRLGQRIMGKNFSPPEKIDRYLRSLKYLFLLLIIALTWHTGTLVFRDLDPWVAYAHIFGGWEKLTERPIGLILLVVTLVGAIFIDRLWCKYLCPLGAFLGLFHKFSLVKLGVDQQQCVQCGKCERKCTMQVSILQDHVQGSECIACGECVNHCVKPGTLAMRFGKKTISILMVGIITIGLFMGTYLAAKSTGLWITKGNAQIHMEEER